MTMSSATHTLPFSVVRWNTSSISALRVLAMAVTEAALRPFASSSS